MSSNELAALLANAKLKLVSGAGHAAPVTHARQINALIAAFLGTKPAGQNPIDAF